MSVAYVRGTVAKYFSEIHRPEDFRIAMGNFLDDFYSADKSERYRMTRDSIDLSNITPDNRKYAAFFAAMTEHLCYHSDIQIPMWTQNLIFRLPKPWFLHENWRFRAWQLTMTPPSFKSRNIFGGDNMLDRV